MEGGSSESLLEKEELKERVKLLTEKIGSLEGEREKMTVKLHHAQETILELQKGVSEGVKSDLAKNEVIAERTVQVTNEEQRIIWEGYGLRHFIPPNSLPDDCSQFTLKIAVSRARTLCFQQREMAFWSVQSMSSMMIWGVGNCVSQSPLKCNTLSQITLILH